MARPSYAEPLFQLSENEQPSQDHRRGCRGDYGVFPVSTKKRGRWTNAGADTLSPAKIARPCCPALKSKVPNLVDLV